MRPKKSKEVYELASKKAKGGISGAAKLLGYNHPEFLKAYSSAGIQNCGRARNRPCPPTPRGQTEKMKSGVKLAICDSLLLAPLLVELISEPLKSQT